MKLAHLDKIVLFNVRAGDAQGAWRTRGRGWGQSQETGRAACSASSAFSTYNTHSDVRHIQHMQHIQPMQ